MVSKGEERRMKELNRARQWGYIENEVQAKGVQCMGKKLADRVIISTVFAMVLVSFLAALARFTEGFPQDKNYSAIQKTVERELQKHGLLAGNAIQVSVGNGAITLTGTVQTLAQKTQAGRDAAAVKRSFSVENNLTLIKSDLTPEQVAEGINTALNKSSSYGIFDRCEFRVDPEGVVTFMGWVYLRGHNAEYTKIAEAQPGVTKVVNELRPILSSDEDNTLRQQVARLIYHRPMAASFARQTGPIHILVENAVVTLAGIVPSEDDINTYGSLVSNNTGALAVVNQLRVKSK
jgi:osmotically-inducible protein OsmY